MDEGLGPSPTEMENSPQSPGGRASPLPPLTSPSADVSALWTSTPGPRPLFHDEGSESPTHSDLTASMAALRSPNYIDAVESDEAIAFLTSLEASLAPTEPDRLADPGLTSFLI
eukprot:m.208967 g.208967  ORF g.208967 m.208967 type:complete len:114 (+) comp15462_c0_seq1:1898-2239(+)